MAAVLLGDNFWTDKARYANAERLYYESLYKGNTCKNQCTLVSEIAKAREHIKNSLEKMDGITNLASTPMNCDVLDRLAEIEKLVEGLQKICLDSQNKIQELELQLQNRNN